MDFNYYPRGLTSISHYTSTTNFFITLLTVLFQACRSREDKLINSILQNKSHLESIAFESTNIVLIEISLSFISVVIILLPLWRQ